MATEAVQNEPEEVPAKEWHYDWPNEPFANEFSKLDTVAGSLKLLDENPDGLGDIAYGLAKIMKGGHLPNPDELETYVKHPLLADRALRKCNLIFYSQAETELTDLSRAVVLLGAKTIRNLLFSTSLINRVLHEPTPKYILPEIVRFNLAGTYAVLFLRRVKAKVLNAEEFYMAGSMPYMPRLLMMYYGADKSKKLEQTLIENKTHVTSELLKQTFGFDERPLAQKLANHWHLGDTLLKTLYGEDDGEQSLEIIECAQMFTEGLLEGHQSKRFHEARKRVSTLCHLGNEAMQDVMLEGLERTIEALSYYDNPDLLEHVPYPKGDDEEHSHFVEESIEYKGEPNPALVNTSIEKLKSYSASHPPFEQVLDEVIEGLSKGCDLDRAAILMIDQKTKIAQIRCLKQIESQELYERFEIKEAKGYFKESLSLDLRDSEGFLVRNILRENKIAWISKASSIVLRKLRNNAFNKTMGYGQFFIAPMTIKKLKLGFYIGDRQVTHRKLDNQTYNLFTDLCVQANLTLEHIEIK